jgi:hypothetical protein
MLNFDRHYEFEFFSVTPGFDDKGNQIPGGNVLVYDTPPVKITDSLNFSFTYSMMPANFNTGKFYLYNISEKTLSLFANKNARRGFFLRCAYGSKENLLNNTIFRGITNRVNNYRVGPDLITEIDAGDMYFNLLQAKIKTLNFPSGTTSEAILRVVSDYLGIFSHIEGFNYLVKKVYTHPITYSNIAIPTILDQVTADSACTWGSDMQGIKIIPLPNNPLKQQDTGSGNNLGNINSTKYPIISAKTGLVGNVRAETLNVQTFPVDYYTQQRLTNNNPFVTATVLMRPFYLRQIVTLQSEIKSLNGDYFVFSVNYTGEYRGNNWYANLKLQPVYS